MLPSRIYGPKCARSKSWKKFPPGSSPRKHRVQISSSSVSIPLTRPISRKKFMDTECELFIPALKDPKFIRLVDENIERIPNGSSSHFAGVLKLGLRKTVELKKWRASSGVMLRCSSIGCPWHTNYVLSSSVGSNAHCSRCGRKSLYCSGCRWEVKATNDSSCFNCRERFM